MAEADEQQPLIQRFRPIARQIGLGRALATAGLLIVALMVARFSWELPLAQVTERTLYDVRATHNAQRVAQDERIVMIVYDDQTLRALEKRSPLDRAMLARALRSLDTMGVKAIGIDILIDQPQREDAELIATFRQMRTPTFLAFATRQNNEEQVDYEQEEYLRGFQNKLRGSAAQATSIRLQTDLDDTVRAWPDQPRGLPPLLSNAVAPIRPEFQTYRGPIAFRLPANSEVPVFAKFPIQTLADPAFAEALKPAFQGRYVLIGGDINDVDQFLTPSTWRTSATTIGLEVHAHMLAQLLDGRRMAPLPGWSLWLASVLVVLAGGLTSMVSLNAWRLTLIFVVQALFLALFPFWLESIRVDTLGVPQFGWALGWIAAYAAAGTAARAVGAEQRQFAEGALGKYLPADVAAQIIRDPESLSLKGEKREIYALFSDLEGFTKLSHAIEPEMVATLLNTYLDTLSDIVLEHGGTIDKFVGDAVVAFWGAPLSRPDDADRAVRAAVAMYQAGERFRADAPPGVPPLGVTRVGLHCGEAIVGNFGGEDRIQYTALGDSMNVAARLESANKYLGTTVLVSETVVERSTFDHFRPLGRIAVSGRSTPLAIFEPVPQLIAGELDRIKDLVCRFDGGDWLALDELQAYSQAHPEDRAVANLAARLKEAGPGGSYVLEQK